MAITLIAHTLKQSTDSNAATTAAIDTTGSSLLVMIVVAIDTVGPGTPSSSPSNAWVQAVQSPGGNGDNQLTVFYVKDPTVSASQTFTFGTVADFPSCCVLAFGATDTSANVDQTNSAYGTASATIQPGSVTPSADLEVLVSACGGSVAAATYSIGSGFTLSDQAAVSPGLGYGIGAAYLVQSAAAASNPTWTQSAGLNGMSAVIVTFRARGGAMPQFLLTGIGT